MRRDSATRLEYLRPIYVAILLSIVGEIGVWVAIPLRGKQCRNATFFYWMALAMCFWV